jgi:hypothetical protein
MSLKEVYREGKSTFAIRHWSDWIDSRVDVFGQYLVCSLGYQIDKGINLSDRLSGDKNESLISADDLGEHLLIASRLFSDLFGYPPLGFPAQVAVSYDYRKYLHLPGAMDYDPYVIKSFIKRLYKPSSIYHRSALDVMPLHGLISVEIPIRNYTSKVKSSDDEHLVRVISNMREGKTFDLSKIPRRTLDDDNIIKAIKAEGSKAMVVTNDTELRQATQGITWNQYFFGGVPKSVQEFIFDEGNFDGYDAHFFEGIQLGEKAEKLLDLYLTGYFRPWREPPRIFNENTGKYYERYFNGLRDHMLKHDRYNLSGLPEPIDMG